MRKRLERMVKNAQNRGEKDNISVIVGVMLDDGKDKCVTVEL